MEFAIPESSTVQSRALSPPPKMIRFLSRYFSLDLTEYEMPLSKYLSGSSIAGGLLGSKDPAPAAIKTLLEINSFPSEVVIFQEEISSSAISSKDSTLSFRNIS